MKVEPAVQEVPIMVRSDKIPKKLKKPKKKAVPPVVAKKSKAKAKAKPKPKKVSSF
jgi:hypothetical protein